MPTFDELRATRISKLQPSIYFFNEGCEKFIKN